LARQMVNHGHIKVGGRRVTVSSCILKTGDEIVVADTPKARQMAARGLEAMQSAPVPTWLTLDKDAFKGVVNRAPNREDIDPIVNEQLIVELYSR